MSIEEIKKLRKQLPASWKWQKCYELQYVKKSGSIVTLKHWALKDPMDKTGVVCLGLVSHDNFSLPTDFRREIPVQFVEKSLEIIDYLIAELEVWKNLPGSM